jgi:hypothetical protein
MVDVVVKASPDVPEFSVAVTVYVPLSAVVADEETLTTPVELFIEIALRPRLLIEYEMFARPPLVLGVVEVAAVPNVVVSAEYPVLKANEVIAFWL